MGWDSLQRTWYELEFTIRRVARSLWRLSYLLLPVLVTFVAVVGVLLLVSIWVSGDFVYSPEHCVAQFIWNLQAGDIASAKFYILDDSLHRKMLYKFVEEWDRGTIGIRGAIERRGRSAECRLDFQSRRGTLYLERHLLVWKIVNLEFVPDDGIGKL